MLELPIVIQTGDNTQVDLYPKTVDRQLYHNYLGSFQIRSLKLHDSITVTHLVLSIVNTRATEIKSQNSLMK